MYGLPGVGGHIFEQTELQIGRCTGRGNARGTTNYSESESSPLCMLDIFLQINVNACGQKLLLWSIRGVYFTIPRLTCKRSGLGGGQNLVFLVGACRLL